MVNNVETKGVFHSNYLELGLSSKRLNNFGIALIGSIIGRKLNANTQFANSDWYWLSSFRGSIFYFPSKRTEDKIILRFTSYLNWEKRTADYAALQIGFRKSLNF